MIAAALRAAGRDPVHNRAGSNMSWGVATALLEQRGSEGLFEVDEAWLPRMAAELDPRPDRARQPVSRPARPLRRARAPRRRVGARWSPSAPAAAASCSTPTIRWSPTSAATASCTAAPASPTSGSRTPRQALPELQHAHDAKHCRRCGHPYSYARAFVGHLGHYECPNCGADRPRPDDRRDRDRAARDARLALADLDPRGRGSSSTCRCPGSTTSTTRSRRSPRRCGSGSALEQAVRGARPGSRRCSGAWRRSRSAARRSRSC